MNIEQLTYIVDLSSSMTIAQTATNLNRSQSAISQSITKLEKELGLKIFNRTNKGAQLTKEGQKIVELSSQILNNIYQLKETARQLSKEKPQQLTIAVANEIPCFFMEAQLQFQEKYPQFRIEVFEADSKDIIESITSNKIDLGLVVLDPLKLAQMNNVKFHKLSTVQLNLYVWKDHYLTKMEEPISIDLLKEQEFILFKDEYIQSFVDYFSRLHGELHVSVRTSSLKILIESLKRFNAVSLIRDVQIKQNLLKISEQELVPININHLFSTKYSYGILTAADAKLSNKEYEFYNLLIDTFHLHQN